jgi:hypothetical protein
MNSEILKKLQNLIIPLIQAGYGTQVKNIIRKHSSTERGLRGMPYEKIPAFEQDVAALEKCCGIGEMLRHSATRKKCYPRPVR